MPEISKHCVIRVLNQKATLCQNIYQYLQSVNSTTQLLSPFAPVNHVLWPTIKHPLAMMAPRLFFSQKNCTKCVCRVASLVLWFPPFPFQLYIFLLFIQFCTKNSRNSIYTSRWSSTPVSSTALNWRPGESWPFSSPGQMKFGIWPPSTAGAGSSSRATLHYVHAPHHLRGICPDFTSFSYLFIRASSRWLSMLLAVLGRDPVLDFLEWHPSPGERYCSSSPGGAEPPTPPPHVVRVAVAKDNYYLPLNFKVLMNA